MTDVLFWIMEKIIHNGNVDEGIRIYMKNILEVKNRYEFSENRTQRGATGLVKMRCIELEEPVIDKEQRFLRMRIWFEGKEEIPGMHIRFTVHDAEDRVVGTGISEHFSGRKKGQQWIEISFDTGELVSGEYSADIAFVEPKNTYQTRHDCVMRAVAFRIKKQETLYKVTWKTSEWGAVCFPVMEVIKE